MQKKPRIAGFISAAESFYLISYIIANIHITHLLR